MQRFSYRNGSSSSTSLSAKSGKQSEAWVKGLGEEEGPEQSAAARLISLPRRMIHIKIWQTRGRDCSQRTKLRDDSFCLRRCVPETCGGVKLQLLSAAATFDWPLPYAGSRRTCTAGASSNQQIFDKVLSVLYFRQ